MHLVMFDIDGTLTATNAVDSRCYLQAIEDVLGIRNVDADWSHYAHVTDQSCAIEIALRHTGKPASDEVVARIRERFIARLEQAAEDRPADFQPVPGVNEMTRLLQQRGDIAIALATGGWHGSALVKLRKSGVNADGMAFASSSDADTRERIMEIAERRAREQGGVSSFETRTYVGDAVWDIRCARNMGYEFIGVASGDRAARLREAGATRIVRDYAGDSAFFSMLGAVWRARGEGVH